MADFMNSYKYRYNLILPCISFFFNTFTIVAYIFIALTCKATIINLEPCALNVDFQHFIPKFNKISLLYGYH